jgi:hypothetical protein
VAQPVLDGADWYAGFMPPRGTSLAQAMQVEVFANRPVFARNLDLFSLFVPACEYRSTLATVQACALGDAFQFRRK